MGAVTVASPCPRHASMREVLVLVLVVRVAVVTSIVCDSAPPPANANAPASTTAAKSNEPICHLHCLE
jgi:hypothetical protein